MEKSANPQFSSVEVSQMDKDFSANLEINFLVIFCKFSFDDFREIPTIFYRNQIE